MAFCFGCMKETNPVKDSIPVVFFTRGVKVEYDELRAYCPSCKREIYDPTLHDSNVINRANAYNRIVKGEYI